MSKEDLPVVKSIIAEDVEKIIASTPVEWDLFKNKRVLITGASGFLPAYIVETLLYLNRTRAFNIQITALVRNRDNYNKRFAAYLNDPNIKVLVQDVSTPINLDLPHHFIIHAASQASPKYYGIDPVGTLSANVIGTMQLLELARNHPIISFLYFSSGEVYGETQKVPTRESDYGYIDPTAVRSCYAESKRMAENMCVAWYSQYNVPTKIVRPFHTYGPGMNLDDSRVYADFISDIIAGNSITLKSDGKATRAFCYLADATAGFFTVLLKGESAVPYNVGNSNAEISIVELAHLLVKAFPEKNLKVVQISKREDSTYIKSPITRSCPDITKIGLLGWSPKVGILNGFKRTVKSYSA